MTAKDISFDNPTESYKVVGDHHKGIYTSNTHPDNSQNTDHVMGGSNNQHSFDTPNILLEQLAYMDTFMPTLGQNFMGSGHLSFSNSGPSLGSILLQNENVKILIVIAMATITTMTQMVVVQDLSFRWMSN